MIKRQHSKAKAAALRELTPEPCSPVSVPTGEVAADVAELTSELRGHPPGDDWRERLEGEFRHLLKRRLQQARLRLTTRPGKPLPRQRVDEIQGLVSVFLAETSRLIEALPIPKHVYQGGSLGPWLEWIEGQFVEQGLGALWAEIRPHLPTVENPSSIIVNAGVMRWIPELPEDTLENT